MAKSNGRIILLNGTSSSGKTTLAQALRLKLEPQFHYYASDQLADQGFRPINAEARVDCRSIFFEGFHKSIAAFAQVGIDLLVEHIIEEQSWADDLEEVLSPFDTFWVGVHATREELERRELVRGDRQTGEAIYHLKTHIYCHYDIEVDTARPMNQIVDAILEAWRRR